MSQPICLPPGQRFRLKDFDPGFKGNPETTKEAASEETKANGDATDQFAECLYAEDRRAVLLVLQGMDTSGKDGTIRRVMGAVDPQSCQVVAFKRPTEEELRHDFLWRIHRAVPPSGRIGIFNRSHYEDVLIVRVHKLVPEEIWKSRYDAINEFEKHLDRCGTKILKVFLHISKDEQRQRLQARLDNPQKWWKFDRQDLVERDRWHEYEAAYEDALSLCNTEHAPWHVVPANHKWYRDLVVSRLLLETLRNLKPQYPQCEEGLDKIRIT